MEETKNMEQPNTSETLETVGDQKAQNENVEKISEVSGSNFGKFKDPATLLSACESLEKEFTKKSQKLAELEKQNKNIQEIKNANLLSDNENTSTETANEDKTSLQCKAKYEDEDWKLMQKTFLKKIKMPNNIQKKFLKLSLMTRFLHLAQIVLNMRLQLQKANMKQTLKVFYLTKHL